MTRPIRMRIAVAAIALTALAGSAVAAQTAEESHARTAFVLAGSAANDPQLVAKARSADADLRVVNENADTLGVTLMLAARGYDEVVTVGVDYRTAIAPVSRRYPHTRFVVAEKGDLERVLDAGA